MFSDRLESIVNKENKYFTNILKMKSIKWIYDASSDVQVWSMEINKIALK